MKDIVGQPKNTLIKPLLYRLVWVCFAIIALLSFASEDFLSSHKVIGIVSFVISLALAGLVLRASKRKKLNAFFVICIFLMGQWWCTEGVLILLTFELLTFFKSDFRFAP